MSSSLIFEYFTRIDASDVEKGKSLAVLTRGEVEEEKWKSSASEGFCAFRIEEQTMIVSLYL